MTVPQLVYAISTAGASQGAYSTETVWNQSAYTMKGVAPGTYFVYSAPRPPTCQPGGRVGGALYSAAVTCGLSASCKDHSPLRVTVRANATTGGIDPVDWYTGTALVPAPPIGIVPADPPFETPVSSYESARDAATAAFKQRESALFVDKMASCPVNRACVSVGVEHDGTSAAYFVGSGGSNADQVKCSAYVFRDAKGWHLLRHDCGFRVIFPAVGAQGHVFLGMGVITGCANVRAAPGPGGKVIGCLPAGTSVAVNGGPVYTPMPKTTGLWWHVTGRGWVIDDFLR